MIKPIKCWKPISGWRQLDRIELMGIGDVVMFFESGLQILLEFTPSVAPDPNPDNIKSSGETTKDGFVIYGYAGKRAFMFEAPSWSEKDGYYMVFRKTGKKEYVPSHWAEPVPLP